MSRPQTKELRLLNQAMNYIDSVAMEMDERLSLIENAAAIHSGADINRYWEIFGYSKHDWSKESKKLNSLIYESPVPYAMAISALSREPLSVEEQRKNGVFYTDFRIATMMASRSSESLSVDSVVGDLAAGTGILLVGLAMEYKKKFSNHFDTWLASNVYAFDLSSNALRGAMAAFLSLTNNIYNLEQMHKNWNICDSLLSDALPKLKLDIVIGNPPWGKVKISRHTFLQQIGVQRTYGSEYIGLSDESFLDEKLIRQRYSKHLKEKFNLLGNAEPDMYMAFLELATSVLNNKGLLLYLIPAGIIRSQGTQNLREFLLGSSEMIRFNLLDNQENYFSIDSRFKFVMIEYKKENTKTDELIDKFIYCTLSEKENDTVKNQEVIFNTQRLMSVRKDLTIPEFKSQAEHTLFFKVYENGRKWGTTDDYWKADISREVDMTNDFSKFQKSSCSGSIPVIEGRMVQHHRFGTKAYVSGSGRSAKWIPTANGCIPQFFCKKNLLSSELQDRVSHVRVGYCDIAGQTNERAMMSSIIPENVVCGNKVPTILFPNDDTGDLKYLWLGITNSFVFDWMIRRIISTTINYFLLFSVPMPKIEINSTIAQEIIENTKQLSNMDEEFYLDRNTDNIRAEIDAAVAIAYGLSVQDMELILKDFPLLDRKQPALDGEKKSTVTKDMVLSAFVHRLGLENHEYDVRMEKEKEIGARAFIPTEMTALIRGI